MDDREFSNVYTIPPNYTDSGKLLGGMLETRNTIEAVFLPVSYTHLRIKMAVCSALLRTAPTTPLRSRQGRGIA